MSRVVRLTSCLGLGASATPAGLVCDPDTGRYELAEAVNVDVVAGRLVRRPGYQRLAELGYRLAAYPLSLLSSAVAAMQGALADLQAGRAPGTRVSFGELRRIVGFDDYEAFLERYADAYVAEMAAFAQAIREDKDTPVTGRDGREPVVIAHAARRSYEERRPVALSEVDPQRARRPQ